MIFSVIKSGYTGWQAVIIFILLSVVFLFAIVGHELSHAYVAVKCGDQTPKACGRLTLNPIAHIDPIGALMFLFVGFGWAKPVPINPLAFKRYRSGIAKVSLAGVTFNLIVCFVSTFFYIMFKSVLVANTFFNSMLITFFYWSMEINALLFILNLLPIYPLDGFNYMSTLFRKNNKFLEYNVRYGYFVLLILAITGALGWILSTLSYYVYWPFVQLWGLIF